MFEDCSTTGFPFLEIEKRGFLGSSGKNERKERKRRIVGGSKAWRRCSVLASFRASLEVLPTRGNHHEYIIERRERPSRGVVLSSYTGEMRVRGIFSPRNGRSGTADHVRGTRNEEREREREREKERGMNGRVEDPDGEIRTPLNPILPPNLR